jgi:ABC-type antimicrobial peptide transport system permease subunit
MKRLNTILNTIMGAFIGVFIGRGIYVIWDFKTHPELYAVQSAPWYTSILVYGAFTIVVLLVCIVIKAIIKSKQK